jgi:hypothetical protein
MDKVYAPGRDTRAQGEQLVFDERLTDFAL